MNRRELLTMCAVAPAACATIPDRRDKPAPSKKPAPQPERRKQTIIVNSIEIRGHDPSQVNEILEVMRRFRPGYLPHS
jgi:hypothetical protein